MAIASQCTAKLLICFNPTSIVAKKLGKLIGFAWLRAAVQRLSATLSLVNIPSAWLRVKGTTKSTSKGPLCSAALRENQAFA